MQERLGVVCNCRYLRVIDISCYCGGHRGDKKKYEMTAAITTACDVNALLPVLRLCANSVCYLPLTTYCHCASGSVNVIVGLLVRSSKYIIGCDCGRNLP